MGFKCGIIGLPNVGKSTLFNALTNSGIAAKNFAFCTIEPNSGIVEVPDLRLQQLQKIVNPKTTIAATMEFVDIAGLVAGASKGEGLGNKFLANIRETEVIAHVVRCFEDENITHISGKIDPIADIETINCELMLADMETVAKAQDKIQRVANTGDKVAKSLLKICELFDSTLAKMQPLSTVVDLEKLAADELEFVKSCNFLTIKKVLYVANVADSNNPGDYYRQVKQFAEANAAIAMPICNQIEAEIAELADADKQVFLEDMSLAEPGLNRLIRVGYQLLNLQTFFTAGEKELRAWTVPQNCLAPQAAGKIHTDFEKGFIRAEVVAFNDFIVANGETGAKAAGKWRLEGKDYALQDGDIVHFRFNV